MLRLADTGVLTPWKVAQLKVQREWDDRKEVNLISSSTSSISSKSSTMFSSNSTSATNTTTITIAAAVVHHMTKLNLSLPLHF